MKQVAFRTGAPKCHAQRRVERLALRRVFWLLLRAIGPEQNRAMNEEEGKTITLTVLECHAMHALRRGGANKTIQTCALSLHCDI